jgi:branched-subunit amino acid aminotransferase/4-amino-4-deoxychorismate lyase
MTPPLSWINGRLTNNEAPVFSSLVVDPIYCDESALAELGCFTTVRVEAGRPTYLQGHLLRLQRDAHTLGLLDLDLDACRRALLELAAAAFTDQHNQQGIIRLTLAPTSVGSATSVVAAARPLNPLPPQWQAISATCPHPGPRAWGGAKLASRALYDSATQQALAAKAQEALFFDEADRLIEGSISNLLFLLPDGTLATPPLERGPVAGLARELCVQGLPGLVEYDLTRQELDRVQCLFAINAVRGAVLINHLDGVALGTANSAVRNQWLKQISRPLLEEAS